MSVFDKPVGGLLSDYSCDIQLLTLNYYEYNTVGFFHSKKFQLLVALLDIWVIVCDVLHRVRVIRGKTNNKVVETFYNSNKMHEKTRC